VNLPRPCLDCGEPSPRTRCPLCEAERQARVDQARGHAAARGYDKAWRRLRARAVRLQPFCLDAQLSPCEGPLTADHLRWPARSLADVEVVCRGHNSARGARRTTGGTPRG
jgi:5-methylcytosine-specific restriction protein A